MVPDCGCLDMEYSFGIFSQTTFPADSYWLPDESPGGFAERGIFRLIINQSLSFGAELHLLRWNSLCNVYLIDLDFAREAFVKGFERWLTSFAFATLEKYLWQFFPTKITLSLRISPYLCKFHLISWIKNVKKMLAVFNFYFILSTNR